MEKVKGEDSVQEVNENQSKSDVMSGTLRQTNTKMQHHTGGNTVLSVYSVQSQKPGRQIQVHSY